MNGFKKAISLVSVLAMVFTMPLQSDAAPGVRSKIGPVVESVVVQADEYSATKRAFNGAIIELKHNRLLLTYDDYSDVKDDSPGVISGKVSHDGGRTWGEKFLIQDNIGEKNVTNQGIIRLKTGELALFFAKQDEHAQIAMYMKTSDDEGMTWDEPQNITPFEGHHVTANDRAVLLSSGRIIIPLGGKTDARPGKSGAFAIYSDDNGDTWHIGDFVNMQEGAPAEPVVVELKDKRVMMYIRTTLGYIYKAYSHDGGASWDDPIPTELESPYAPVMIKRIPDNSNGHLLLVWNNTKGPSRRPLSMAVSRDDGMTWSQPVNLEPPDRGVNSYPSIATHHGEVLITYYTYNPLPDGSYTLPMKLQIWRMSDLFKLKPESSSKS
ncbi:glycoside hydrolase [Paenibacillus sp. J5C_2022]|uniref:sialidase family protein n=1 Tax=Paenibacillus sp. J5C2022 TaxID=2977129 RepID=UPI0021CEA0C3|nr:sialidase family protein [Paenibacillus sp. J5C2022]MCU6712195.1 glycoside hydrolase [Paenibacillus sp. J5C2022]